jgi:predicted molibdopterin-dependent oxidoreductase YjgC
MGGLPNVFPAYQQVANEDARKKFETAWGATLSGKPGLTIVEIMNAAGRGDIKAIYIMGENPLISDPDLHHIKKELQKLDLLVVQDIFLTETAELADVVLPSASFAEKDGTFTNTERCVQRIRKVVNAPGEAKPDWEIIAGISTKMGYPMNYSSAKEIFEEIAKVTPSYAGISYERIEKEGIQWPCPTPEHQGTKFLHKEKFSRGLGLFHAIEYIPPAELPDKEYPLILSTGRVLYHYHTGTMTRRAVGPSERCPESLIEIHPADAVKFGVNDGQIVKVTSRRGTVEAKAQITQKSPQGTIFMNFHFAEAAVNLLTNSVLDPIGKIPEYKVCAVKLEAA